MQKVIGVTELQRHFHSVFEEVAEENIPYVLTRNSRPEAALIPYDTFLLLTQLQEETLLAEYDRLAEEVAQYNAQYSDEEIETDISNAIAEVRREQGGS